MKKALLTAACALALAIVPTMAGKDNAYAIDDFWKAFGVGALTGLVVGGIVRANQYHCHTASWCHRHGYARPGHYHRFQGGPVVYYQAAPAPPPPQAVGYPPEHYQWCANQYRSFHAQSNTWQPYGGVPRRQCISPFIQ